MKKIFLFAVAIFATLSLSAQQVMTCDDAYAAARALSAGDTLHVDGVTVIVEVTGFVTNGGNGTVSGGMQTFYIGQTATEQTKTIQVYKGAMGEQAAVGNGDQVKVTGKLMHYVNKSGTTDVAELVNSTVEVLSRVEVKVDTISDLSVCEIITEGESLNGGAYSSDFFEITAIVDSLTFTNESAKQQTFFFYCQANGKTLQAYNAYMQDTLAALGDTVKVLGKITLYAQKNQVEFESPKAWVVGKLKVNTIEATVAEAKAVALALPQNGLTKDRYAVTGYVDSIIAAYDADFGNISFFMTDDIENPTYDFEAYRVKATAEQAAKIAIGAKVKVTSTLKHFYKEETDAESGETSVTDIAEADAGGSLEILEEVAAVDNIFSGVKSVKRIENGQVIIIRNGVRYNLLGTEVR